MEKTQKINITQFLIGAAVLLIGTLVYLVDRPPDQTYFVTWSRFNISLYDALPNLFGIIGNSLPTFSHAFAFILITAGLMSSSKKGCLIVTLCWFFTDSAFEIGQRYGASIAALVPDWFVGIPFLENTKSYFRKGTFDWIDMWAIFAGSLLGYIVLLITLKEE